MGEVVEGGNMRAVNPASFSIHAAVHNARRDIVTAAHGHSAPSKAFSGTGLYKSTNISVSFFLQD